MFPRKCKRNIIAAAAMPVIYYFFIHLFFLSKLSVYTFMWYIRECSRVHSMHIQDAYLFWLRRGYLSID